MKDDSLFRTLSAVIKALLFIMMVKAVYEGNSILAIAAAIGFVTMALASPLIYAVKGIVIPAFVDFAVSMAFFLHLFGWMASAYYVIPHYDKVLHVYSSILVALLAFMLFYVRERYSYDFRVGVRMMLFLTVMVTRP